MTLDRPNVQTMLDGLQIPALTDVAAQDLAELCRRCSVRRLDLFGSAVTDRFDPTRSDLDFLVSFDAPSHRDYADAFFALREELGKLFGRDVDLITEASLGNPFFREQVERERVLLFVC